jgi:hypothetical protein
MNVELKGVSAYKVEFTLPNSQSSGSVENNEKLPDNAGTHTLVSGSTDLHGLRDDPSHISTHKSLL